MLTMKVMVLKNNLLNGSFTVNDFKDFLIYFNITI